MKALGSSLYPEGHPTLGELRLADHHHPFRTGSNQRLQALSAKGAAAAEHVDRLQQAGLAGGVRAADEREIRIEVEIGAMQAAEVRHLHPPQRHPIRASW